MHMYPLGLGGSGSPFCTYPERNVSQRVLSTHMGNTYPNQKGNYYYVNHTLYHIGTLDPSGIVSSMKVWPTLFEHSTIPKGAGHLNNTLQVPKLILNPKLVGPAGTHTWLFNLGSSSIDISKDPSRKRRVCCDTGGRVAFG